MAPRGHAGVRCVVLAGSALLALPLAAGASLIGNASRLLCRDRSPKVGCELTIEFHDSTQLLASATAVTTADGSFTSTLNCGRSNQIGEYLVVTAACCHQSWTVSRDACDGNFGTFVCDDCGGAGCAKPPSGMVAWWPFDEESGAQAADVAGNHTGAYQGAPAPIDGVVGKALSFNGHTDEIRVPDAPALDFGASPGGDFSIDFWLRTADQNLVASILDKRESAASPRGYAVFLSNGRLALQLAEGGASTCDSTTATGCTNYDSGIAVADGQWHHLAVTVDRDAADGIRWYLDGAEAGTRGNPTLRGDSLSNGAPLLIAAHAFFGLGAALKGDLDELELFDRALTPDEVQAIYAAGANGKCRDDLVAQRNASLCPKAATASVTERLCNFSTAAQSYDLAFTPATAADDPSCTLPAPAGFTLAPPATLPILVPPASCRSVDVTIARPAEAGGTSGVSCYRATMRNEGSGAVVEAIGSLALQSICSRFGDFFLGSQVGEYLPHSFVFSNPGDTPTTILYQLEARPASGNPQDAILSLLAPGQAAAARAAASPVTGAISLPARGSGTVSVLASLLAPEPLNVQEILLRDRSTGAVLASESVRAFSPGCTPGPTVLCLHGGRFEVKVAWKDFAGNTGLGQAVALTGDTGYFWFFNPANVELVLKVLDGRAVNGEFWVFYGALSTVEYAITVTDTETGASRTFANPSGHLASVAETSALPGDVSAAQAAPATTPSAPRPAETATAAISRAVAPPPTCTPGATALCLNGGRFRVEATWKDFFGNTGTSQAVAITGDTGYFWFFNPANVELALKVIDGTPLNHRWWVFYGALSSVEYHVKVTDTATGAFKEYTNPSGTLGSVADTSAFPE
jgi:concanavalin A-like lectin/glucanase superfamily protein